MPPESRHEPRDCTRPTATATAVAGPRGGVASPVAVATADRGRRYRTQTAPLAGAEA